MRFLAAMAMAALAACAPMESVTVAEAPRAVMTWPDLLERPRPQADARISYGPLPQQVADVWLPQGDGPHPVVVMVHGGCWTKSIADLSIMNYIADDLRTHGVAVWNIEYRGIDEDGGGYPGTFLDVAAAADALRDHAARFNLSLERIAAQGHSAGGHLALWLAARPNLPAWSPMRQDNPLRIDAVISAGGLPDLEANYALGEASCGDEALNGIRGPVRENMYADTSPAELMPFSAAQFIVNSDRDRIAPPAHGELYVAKARTLQSSAQFFSIENEAHVELIAPDSRSWAQEREIILAALGLRPGMLTIIFRDPIEESEE